MTEQEIDYLTDLVVINQQPENTIAKVYNAADGYGLSTRARKEIRRLVSSYALTQLQNNRLLTWNTFTLPEFVGVYDKETETIRKYDRKVDDKRVLDAFKSFLKKQKSHGTLKSYLWVAERQDGKRNKYARKTDRIHFHAILSWHEKEDIRRTNLSWLYELNKIGYQIFMKPDSIDKKIYKGSQRVKVVNGQKLITDVPPLCKDEKLIRRYAKSCGIIYMPRLHDDIVKIFAADMKSQCFTQSWHKVIAHLPLSSALDINCPLLNFVLNPVDYEYIYEFKKLQVYLTKYVTKQEKDAVVFCRPWACSRDFSALITGMNVTYDEYECIKNDPANIYKARTYSRPIGEQQFTFTVNYLTSNVVNNEVHKKFVRHVDIESEQNLSEYARKNLEFFGGWNPDTVDKVAIHNSVAEAMAVGKPDVLIYDEFSNWSHHQLISYLLYTDFDTIKKTLVMRYQPFINQAVNELEQFRPELSVLTKVSLNG